MIPFSFDNDIHALLKTNALSLPVHKGEYIPPPDLAPYKSGYVTWGYDEFVSPVNSEGHLSSGGKQFVDFEIDIAVYADTNAKRIAAMDAVLDILQPVVAGKRTLLTSYVYGSTFFNYVRLVTSTHLFSVKTGQSTAEVAGILMSFACRVTV